MTWTESKFDWSGQVKKLGCRDFDGITILPFNLETADKYDDLEYPFAAPVVRNLFKTNSIEVNRLEKDAKDFACGEERAADWNFYLSVVGGTVVVPIALNVLANYISDYLKGKKSVKVLLLEIDEKQGKFRKFEVEGEADNVVKALLAVKEEVAKQIEDKK